MYSYVFFDLDGTLTQSEFGILEGARRALSHFGIDTSDEKKLKKFIGPPLHVSFHDNYGLSEEDTEEAISIYRAYYRAKGIYQAPLYEGMFALLSDLKNAGRKLMITTSKPLVMAEKVAKNNEIYDLFDGIIGPGLDEKMRARPGSSGGPWKNSAFRMRIGRRWSWSATVSTISRGPVKPAWIPSAYSMDTARKRNFAERGPRILRRMCRHCGNYYWTDPPIRSKNNFSFTI